MCAGTPGDSVGSQDPKLCSDSLSFNHVFYPFWRPALEGSRESMDAGSPGATFMHRSQRASETRQGFTVEGSTDVEGALPGWA